jgi:hypothetical protein
MRKIILFLDKHSQLVFRIFFYFVSVGVILWIYPREGNFPYEFQRGKVWLHNDLFSTFDFPIQKSEAEIKSERDSILKEFKPYFTYQNDVVSEQLKKFNKAFGAEWKKFAEGRAGNSSSAGTAAFFKQADTITKSSYQSFASDLIRYAYQKGIVQSTEQIDQFPSKNFQIVVIKDKVGEEFDYADVFTEKSAYELIRSKISALKDASEFDQIIYKSGFFNELNLNQFLLPNLIYNEEASKNVKDELVKKISITKGMFLSDRKVIGKGEVVNDEKYNVLVSLKYEYENKLGKSNKIGYVILGQGIIIGSLLLLLLLFLLSFRKEVYFNNLKFSFIYFLIITVVGISSIIIRKELVALYVVPFALLPIIIKTFYDARLALYVHIVCILMVGFMAPNGFEFIFLNFISGSVAIISLTSLYRRGKLFNTAFFVIITYCIVYIGILLVQGIQLSDQLPWQNFIYFGASGFLLLMAYPLIFVFEKLFGFLSDITLMELSDTNQTLLRKLNETAPGTFQHSLQVANLAEEAAYRIGANSLLVRTGALYHDIGKMYNPMYFIENLSTEKNPHADLAFEESARLIINHIYKGIEIGRRYRLPEQIIDFIRTHHGTTTVQFFYKSYKKQYPDNEVDKSKFTYPGPIPFSKEMALVMMADSVEAASRSLREITPLSISDLVDNIIHYQMINDQYNNSNITYKEIITVKGIFKRKLMNIYHVRVEYPE